MQAKGWVLFRVLLNRFQGGVVDGLSKFLPEGDFKRLQRLTVESKDIEPIVGNAATQLQQIHFSWLVPLFKDMTPQLQDAMILSLPTAAAAAVSTRSEERFLGQRSLPPCRSFCWPP